ncbi:g7708 [Coccomyxa viridis]|uniref:Biogenesis of lysosome-related organelles complex 1 subunit 1 n=1 Tax=Coccomyxa viridis TaxID=1274662 RepID=A0ABP1G0Z8_9CHLO
MFKTLLQEHNAKVAEIRRQSDKAKAAAETSGEKLAGALVDAVDSQVSKAFQQEKDLSREAREARNLASKFRDQTAGWISAAQRADKVLRDYGDYETYLQTIVSDMTEVQSMLQELAQCRAAKASPQK